MRIRTIKPEFWAHEEMSALPPETALLAIGLLNYADDHGYFRANPELIKAAIFPLRSLSRSITVLIRELSELGYIRIRKSAVDGKEYGFIVKFDEHQFVNKAKASKIKDLCDFTSQDGSDTVVIPSQYREEGKGTGKGKEGKVVAIPYPKELDTPEFRDAWAKYMGYRTSKKLSKLQPQSIEAKFTEMVSWGLPNAIESIRQTIANGWTGLFFPKSSAPTQTTPRWKLESQLKEAQSELASVGGTLSGAGAEAVNAARQAKRDSLRTRIAALQTQIDASP